MHTETIRDQKTRQPQIVVAVVVYVLFQLRDLNWESFGVLVWRSLKGGSRLREVVAHSGSTVEYVVYRLVFL